MVCRSLNDRCDRGQRLQFEIESGNVVSGVENAGRLVGHWELLLRLTRLLHSLQLVRKRALATVRYSPGEWAGARPLQCAEFRRGRLRCGRTALPIRSRSPPIELERDGASLSPTQAQAESHHEHCACVAKDASCANWTSCSLCSTIISLGYVEVPRYDECRCSEKGISKEEHNHSKVQHPSDRIYFCRETLLVQIPVCARSHLRLL